MNIHEYQAIEILKAHGVNVPNGDVASTPSEAEAIARKLDCSTYVVKAQIHAGGRGKGGGVKLAKSPEEVGIHADAILGMQLVTHQTGPEGKLVRKVLVAEASEIVDEFYLGIVLDRASSRIVLMASGEGGVNIEEVASTASRKDFQGDGRPDSRVAPLPSTAAGLQSCHPQRSRPESRLH